MFDQLKMNFEVLAISMGIVAGTMLIAFLFNRLFRRFIRRNSLLIRNDPTNYVFLRHAITGIIYIVGFSWAVYSVPSLRAVANSLLAGAGILAVAVGFASQHALSNIISGIFIVIFKPFSVNDRLRFQNGLQGVVEDITLRHVVIRDFENRRILIPNSVISEEIIVNADFGDDTICKFLEIDISYDSNIDRARAIMQEEALRHPLQIDGRTPEQIQAGRPEILVRVIALGEYYVRLRAYIWARNNAEAFELGCDLMESIKKRFDLEGIEIPFPYRTIVQKEPKTREEFPQEEG
ncbi:MAG: mechanosensitive ion channel family protein [Lewinellaceae bacterium]|nr:mechanosensitive ion channel family protein [Phaeodactylibacter sp.]MCB9040473.1 mechanosensitive ion channel family protein [Lewinellaceae bacterium]